MTQTDTSNTNFQLAANFIQHTNQSVFLTGKAGTGKTTFLKYIRNHCLQQIAVVAPTGVAAINAGGVTIHSFFQLPFGPFLPENIGLFGNQDYFNPRHSLLGKMRMNNNQRKVLQQLELLVIDEISMVRCDTLDAIDTILRSLRKRYQEPFGGVQLLFIGDMHQLPPVIPDEEWQLLNRFYKSPYFFDSKVMQTFPAAYIELDKIYRQTDATFIHILNKVRNNTLDEPTLELLHQQYQPNFQPHKKVGYITLTTHNKKADIINEEALQRISKPDVAFKATIEGEFNEKAYPADVQLRLKEGAQVMFIKNDVEKVRRYYNGKIGTVSRIEEGSIFVQCEGETTEIQVEKEKWRNIKYTLNPTTQKLEEEEVGSFTQFPLRLAWAITIHKSQGLTFEKAVIDAGAAFAPGQVYVALSRCTSLEGIVLLSKINRHSLHNDERIAQFASQKLANKQADAVLHQGKYHYQLNLLINLFDFSVTDASVLEWKQLVTDHQTAFNDTTLPFVLQIQEATAHLQQTGQKFALQLTQIASSNTATLPENNAALQDRVIAGATYFAEQTQQLIQLLNQSLATTDSRSVATAYNESIKDIFAFIAQKNHLLKACLYGLHCEILQQEKNKFLLPPFSANAYAKNSSTVPTQVAHPALFAALKEMRDQLAEQEDLPIYLIAGTNSLVEMVRYLPHTKEDLIHIIGFGKEKKKKYGQQFIGIIQNYCQQQQLQSLMHEKNTASAKKAEPHATPKTAKTASYKLSLQLFLEGSSCDSIAQTRNLAPSTIESHLLQAIKQQELTLLQWIGQEKIDLLMPFLAESLTITDIKTSIGEAATFGEIRAFLHVYQPTQTPENSTSESELGK